MSELLSEDYQYAIMEDIRTKVFDLFENGLKRNINNLVRQEIMARRAFSSDEERVRYVANHIWDVLSGGRRVKKALGYSIPAQYHGDIDAALDYLIAQEKVVIDGSGCYFALFDGLIVTGVRHFTMHPITPDNEEVVNSVAEMIRTALIEHGPMTVNTVLSGYVPRELYLPGYTAVCLLGHQGRVTPTYARGFTDDPLLTVAR